jgi:hypothetical protein
VRSRPLSCRYGAAAGLQVSPDPVVPLMLDVHRELAADAVEKQGVVRRERELSRCPYRRRRGAVAHLRRSLVLSHPSQSDTILPFTSIYSVRIFFRPKTIGPAL